MNPPSDQMTIPDPLHALIEHWRATAKLIADVSRAYEQASTLLQCADELATALAAASPPPQPEDALRIAQQTLRLSSVMKKPNPALVTLAQAVVAATDRHIEDYRSGYSAGWSHGTNGEPMQGLASARVFFGVAASPPQEARPQETIGSLLDAPCRWCGYNGPGYWQAKTHVPTCPFYFLGDGQARLNLLRDFPSELRASRLSAALPPSQEPTPPHSQKDGD